MWWNLTCKSLNLVIHLHPSLFCVNDFTFNDFDFDCLIIEIFTHYVFYISHADTIRCITNLSTSGAVEENDVIVTTCSVTYSGNWVPVMRWFNSVTLYNFTDDNITLTTSDTTVTSRLTVTASAGLHSCQIVCLTYFTEPSSVNTSATNVPHYMDTWTSPTINVTVPCK